MHYNIKTKTSDKCRVYPDNPGGLAPSVTSICDSLMKFGLIQWAADEAVKWIKEESDRQISVGGITYWDYGFSSMFDRY